MFVGRPWPALVCALLSLPLAGWALSTPDNPATEAGTWAAAALGASYSLVLAAAPLCLGGAVEVGRLRSAGVFSGTRVRPVAAVVAMQVWPLLLAPIVIAALGMGVAARRVHAQQVGGPPSAFDIGLMTLAIVTGWVMVLIGAALGRHLPRLIALPLAAIGAYQFMMTAFWLPSFHWRHIWGFDWWVWRPELTWDLKAQVAPFITWSGLGIGALALSFLPRHRPRTQAIVSAAVVASLALSTLGASLMTAKYADREAPMATRPIAELRCLGHKPRVCLWPEHEGQRARITAAATDISRTLERYGVAEHDEISELEGAPWPVFVRPNLDDATLKSSLLGNYIIMPPKACEGGSFRWPEFIPYLRTWLGLVNGETVAHATQAYGPEVVTHVQTIMTWSPDRQGRWYRANWAAGQQCNTSPIMEVP